MLICWIIFLAFASVQSRTFNNPVLDGKNYWEPSVLKFNGTYYLVTDIEDIREGVFPIHSSTDLVTWTFEGYVFEGSNTTKWARRDSLRDPEIHQIGSSFIVYFSGFNNSNPNYGVGATVASHPLGPYTPIDDPILDEDGNSIYEPTVMKDDGNLYLLWRRSTSVIYARQLTSTGLTFSSTDSPSLLRPSLNWENGYLQAVNYIRRGDYHYLIYSGGLTCGEMSVGVARSISALGPYKKFYEPIIVYNDNYYCTNHAVIVKDLDDESDVVFFNAIKWDGSNRSDVIMASVDWTSDDWPTVGEF